MKFWLRVPFIIALLALMITPAVAQETDCNTSTNYQQQAADNFAAGNYAASAEAYSCVIEHDPLDTAAYKGRMEASLLSGDYGQAVLDHNHLYTVDQAAITTYQAEYTNAITAAPNDIKNYILRGFSYWFMSLYAEAIADYNRILQIDPNNSFAYLYRGIVNQYQNVVDTVPIDFEQAIALDPTNENVYLQMSGAYQTTGQLDLAMAAVNRLIAVDSKNAEGYFYRGTINSGLGDYAAANADYTQAISYDPDHAYAHLGRGTDALAQGDFRLAASDYDKFIKITRLETIAGQALLPDEQVTLPMTAGRVYELPIEVESGQQFTLNATDSTTAVDPLIVLLDPTGTPVICNDDIDGANQNYNAEIRNYTFTTAGTYTLLVTHAGAGSEGTVDVLMSRGARQ